jgi:DNA repair protein RecN (Recombination protein N)
MIRAGADKMAAEAVFDVPREAHDALDELGVDAADSEVIVKREIATNGRGRVLINGSPLSVRELGGAMDAFLEIHGQHESNGRVAGQGYRELLDDYGDHAALRAATRDAHGSWRETAEQLRELTDAQRDRTLRLDLLRYQIEEISAAKIDPVEEEALRGERSMLANARQLAEASSGAFALVDDDESSALAQLARALHLVQPLAGEIADIAAIKGELEDAIYRLQETSRGLSRLSDSVRHDPVRLEEIEDRLVTIERLKKKYGGSVEAVLTHLSSIQDEFERLSDYETSVDKLQRIEEQRFAAWRSAAQSLSAARKKAAKKFESAIQSELASISCRSPSATKWRDGWPGS